MQNENAKYVIEHVHERVAIRNGTDTRVDAVGKDAAMWDYNLFSQDIANGKQSPEQEREVCHWVDA